MFAIRARRKVATERDFLDAVEKVVRQGTKFSSTYVYSSACWGYLTQLLYTGPCIRCTTRHPVDDLYDTYGRLTLFVVSSDP